MDSTEISASTSSIESCQHQIKEVDKTLEDVSTQLRSLLLLMAPNLTNSIPYHLDSLDMFEFLLFISDKIQNSKLLIQNLSDNFQKHSDKHNPTTAEYVGESVVARRVNKKVSKRSRRHTFPEPNIVLGRREVNKSAAYKYQFESGWKSVVVEITKRKQPEKVLPVKDAEIPHGDQDLQCIKLKRSNSCIDLSQYVKLDTEHTLINNNATIVREDNERMVADNITHLINNLDLETSTETDINLVFRIEDVIETLRCNKAKKRFRISSRIMSGLRRIRKVLTHPFTTCLGRKNTL